MEKYDFPKLEPKCLDNNNVTGFYLKDEVEGGKTGRKKSKKRIERGVPYCSLKRTLNVVRLDHNELDILAELEALVDIFKVLEDGGPRQVLVGLLDLQQEVGGGSEVAVRRASVLRPVDHGRGDDVVDRRTH